MNKGWISLHRKVLDNPLFTRSRKYSNFEAWIWLLLRANHSDAKVLIGMQMMKIKKGQMITSQQKLCIQFKWGNSKLRNFLKLLKDEHMIEIKTTTQLTCITILNYNKFQENQIINKSQINNDQSANKSQTNINNNNKIKKNKKSIKERETEFINKVCSEGLKRVPSVDPEIIKAFCSYWTESNEGASKMKFEMQKAFDISRRLGVWIRNDFGSSKLKRSDDLSKFKKTPMGEYMVYCSACFHTLFSQN